ncbi:MAG: hypothetical protein RBS29_08150, partial [Bacteroidales bacterium]|nr:hypothetical protein [Bacteroidales bacterium]
MIKPFNLSSMPASVIAKGDTLDFTGADISRITLDANSYCDYKINTTTGFTLNTVWNKWSSSTETYFNDQKNKNKPALDLRIMAYDYGNGSNNEELCNSLGGKYYNCSDSTKIKCPQTPTPRKNACLLSID